MCSFLPPPQDHGPKFHGGGGEEVRGWWFSLVAKQVGVGVDLTVQYDHQLGLVISETMLDHGHFESGSWP